MNIGRNAACWCNSGNKYKRCHLDRDKQNPIPKWDKWDKFNRSLESKICLSPTQWHGECESGISRSHTVPKSSSLRRIAQDGHVYSLVPNPLEIEKNSGFINPQLIGVNRASTFPGFCSRHDNDIFSPLETQGFSGAADQCFLIAYRALAREMYTKRAASQFIDTLRQADRGKILEEQISIQTLMNSLASGTAVAVRTTEYYKAIFDEMLVTHGYSNIEGYVIEFDDAPAVMCSGAIFPVQDFNGVELQELGHPDKIPDLLCFSSFYSKEQQGVMAFSWLSQHSLSCRRLIDSLKVIPDESITEALLRFIFESCENLHISPTWWENIPHRSRTAFIERFNAAGDLLTDRAGALRMDGQMSCQPWPIVSRYDITSGDLC